MSLQPGKSRYTCFGGLRLPMKFRAGLSSIIGRCGATPLVSYYQIDQSVWTVYPIYRWSPVYCRTTPLKFITYSHSPALETHWSMRQTWFKKSYHTGYLIHWLSNIYWSIGYCNAHCRHLPDLGNKLYLVDWWLSWHGVTRLLAEALGLMTMLWKCNL